MGSVYQLSPLTQRRINCILSDNCEDFPSRGAVAFIKDVKPVLQKGPQCGLVVLQMVAQAYGLLTRSMDEIFLVAKKKGYTNHGEIFSAFWLADLAVSLWPSMVVTVEKTPPTAQMEQLIKENAFLLIPYDCDKNHEPTQRGGKNAHWCVVVGYLCPVKELDVMVWNTTFAHACSSATHVFCRHGKSRHVAVWNYAKLVESNRNLREPAAGLKGTNYMIPSNDLSTLCNQSLVVRCHSDVSVSNIAS